MFGTIEKSIFAIFFLQFFLTMSIHSKKSFFSPRGKAPAMMFRGRWGGSYDNEFYRTKMRFMGREWGLWNSIKFSGRKLRLIKEVQLAVLLFKRADINEIIWNLLSSRIDCKVFWLPQTIPKCWVEKLV